MTLGEDASLVPPYNSLEETGIDLSPDVKAMINVDTENHTLKSNASIPNCCQWPSLGCCSAILIMFPRLLGRRFRDRFNTDTGGFPCRAVLNQWYCVSNLGIST